MELLVNRLPHLFQLVVVGLLKGLQLLANRLLDFGQALALLLPALGEALLEVPGEGSEAIGQPQGQPLQLFLLGSGHGPVQARQLVAQGSQLNAQVRLTVSAGAGNFFGNRAGQVVEARVPPGAEGGPGGAACGEEREQG